MGFRTKYVSCTARSEISRPFLLCPSFSFRSFFISHSVSVFFPSPPPPPPTHTHTHPTPPHSLLFVCSLLAPFFDLVLSYAFMGPLAQNQPVTVHTHQAKFVICSVPPALMGKIRFQPPLSALKNQVRPVSGTSEQVGLSVWGR